MAPRRAAARSLAAAIAVFLLAAAAVVDARGVVSVLHSGHSLAETPGSSKSAAAAAAAIQAALVKTKQVDKLAAKVSATSSPRVKQCLDVCRENFEFAVDSLSTAYDYVVNGHGSRDDLINKLSDAVTDVGTCDDAFAEEPGLESPIADDFHKLTDLVSTSLDKGAELPDI